MTKLKRISSIHLKRLSLLIVLIVVCLGIYAGVTSSSVLSIKGGEGIRGVALNEKENNAPQLKGVSQYSMPSPEQGKFIEADLQKKELKVYDNGEVVETLSIVSIGREGTAWETVGGSFDIKYKNEKHFSSIGKVWMPYAMQYFGNYFIHGWPYYTDGTPVGEGYSGGCIRLTTEDAKKVYDLIEVGTPLMVKGIRSGSEKPLGAYNPIETAKEQEITAGAYLVADLETGEVLMEKNRNTAYPINSLTKLMTSMISLEMLSQIRLYTF